MMSFPFPSAQVVIFYNDCFSLTSSVSFTKIYQLRRAGPEMLPNDLPFFSLRDYEKLTEPTANLSNFWGDYMFGTRIKFVDPLAE